MLDLGGYNQFNNAYQNNKINITAIENNDTYLEIANENIVINNFQKN